MNVISTGIVRRIDDLGRVVIPKDIRRKMGLQPGDCVEMGLSGTALIAWKYEADDTTPVNLGQTEIGAILFCLADYNEHGPEKEWSLDKEALLLKLKDAFTRLQVPNSD
jgi:AbrB family looped-hinge helix DNA binding protein